MLTMTDVQNGLMENLGSRLQWQQKILSSTRQFMQICRRDTNNKAKVTMRKAYGYRTFKAVELSLYHVLGKLPEPKLAHDFY